MDSKAYSVGPYKLVILQISVARSCMGLYITTV